MKTKISIPFESTAEAIIFKHFLVNALAKSMWKDAKIYIWPSRLTAKQRKRKKRSVSKSKTCDE